MITRSGLTVFLAVAMLATGVLITLRGASDSPPQRDLSSAVRPSRTDSLLDGPLASGRGATYPGPHALSNRVPDAAALPARELGKGISFANRLRNVEPCRLLQRSSVAAALGGRMRTEPYSGPGTVRCRWVVDVREPFGRPEAEINLTVARDALFESVAASRVRPLRGLGDEAVVSGDASDGLVAIRERKIALVLAVSSRLAGRPPVTALAREAHTALERGLTSEPGRD